MPYPGCKQEVKFYLGVDVGVKKGQGQGLDAPTPVARTFSGSSGPASTLCLPRPLLLRFTCSATTMAEYSYVKSTKLVLKGTKAKR